MTMNPGTELDAYFKLKSLIRRTENYVPRNYQTIGGMWTTDTYKRGEVTVQIMDEGYSARLFTKTNELDVIESYQNGRTIIEFKAGGADQLRAALGALEGQADET